MKVLTHEANASRSTNAARARLSISSSAAPGCGRRLSISSIETPWFVGAGYVAYGLALAFAPKNSKAFALATGLFGMTVVTHAVVLYKRAKDSEALSLGGGNGAVDGDGQLGETLQEALGRTQGAVSGGPVEAPTLKSRVDILRMLVRKGSEDPEVRAKALAVLSRRCGSGNERKWCVPAKNWKAEISAIFNAFKDPRSDIAVRYTRDPLTKDTFTGAAKTIGALHAGDCDDAAVSLGALLMSVGYPVRFVIGRGKNSPGPSHIWIRAGVPPGGGKVTKWVPLDATVDKPAGWEAGSDLIVQKWEYDV